MRLILLWGIIILISPISGVTIYNDLEVPPHGFAEDYTIIIHVPTGRIPLGGSRSTGDGYIVLEYGNVIHNTRVFIVLESHTPGPWDNTATIYITNDGVDIPPGWRMIRCVSNFTGNKECTEEKKVRIGASCSQKEKKCCCPITSTVRCKKKSCCTNTRCY